MPLSARVGEPFSLGSQNSPERTPARSRRSSLMGSRISPERTPARKQKIESDGFRAEYERYQCVPCPCPATGQCVPCRVRAVSVSPERLPGGSGEGTGVGTGARTRADSCPVACPESRAHPCPVQGNYISITHVLRLAPCMHGRDTARTMHT